eukprot:TRINITY_DN4619_c0_g1_i1.p1 TRINITY_DN4619_c0_g1~~TRINITY_DN4619_c0_g1_i1.p1  ORF type:complete len:179 (+),score=50.76 TRINITY_DN4619_c0_g1_i1:91-627(+)
MAEPLPNDLVGCNNAISVALGDLIKTNNDITQVSAYCKQGPFKPGNEEAFKETEQFTTNSLLNVAYQIHRVGLHLTNFLEIQSLELEKVDLMIKHLAVRCGSTVDQCAASSFVTADYFKSYQRTQKEIKLDFTQMSESARPRKFVRQPLNPDHVLQSRTMLFEAPTLVEPTPFSLINK